MVRVNKDNPQFVAFGDLPNKSRISRGVEANQRHKLRKRLPNFKTSRARSVDGALDVDVDCINPARAISTMLAKQSGCDERGRKTGQRPNFDHALRRENADKSGQKKIIARSNRARMPSPAPLHN